MCGIHSAEHRTHLSMIFLSGVMRWIRAVPDLPSYIAIEVRKEDLGLTFDVPDPGVHCKSDDQSDSRWKRTYDLSSNEDTC